MKTRFALIASLCLLAGCSAQGPDNRTADLRGKRVLVFTGHGEGYVHENIAASAAMILELAAQEDFAADTTSDKRVFCDDSLERYEDELYCFKRLDPQARVLAVWETAGVDWGSGPKPEVMSPSLPAVWCSEFDGGRIWYTAAGHRPSDYADTLYREQVLGGLRWIMAGQARDTETAE